MAEYDAGYKRLFSHPEMVADLLRGFIDEPWVAELDFSSLEQVRASFVSAAFRQRESDVIWRVRHRGQWLYVYLLLEFQTTVDPFMAVRLMVYVGLLYQTLIRSGELPAGRRLPPVLPIVLYNGEAPWGAPLDVADLVVEVPGGLRAYCPRMRYLLLEERRYSESELSGMRNLAAALFRLENARVPADVKRVVKALAKWLAEGGQSELARTFTEWLRQILLPSWLPGVQLPPFSGLEEVDTLLTERVKEWTHQWREEGRQEGRKEGEANVLIRQLERKFGPISEEVRRRIQSADSEQLLHWAERILWAERLEEVFQ
jgi:hypothetical protein